MWPWRQNSSYAKRDVQTRCKDTVTSQPVDQCELLHVDSELYDDRSTGGQVNALEANQLLDDRVVPSRITCSGHHNRAAKRVTSWHGTTISHTPSYPVMVTLLGLMNAKTTSSPTRVPVFFTMHRKNCSWGSPPCREVAVVNCVPRLRCIICVHVIVKLV